jgi:hypothetical protein
VRSGNYEVDAEGDAAREGGEPSPIPVRRAMRVYGFAQLVSFAILLVTAISMPEIRGLLLLLAAAYAVVAFGLHRLYRRALMRRYGKR